jgi:hypothetical protein
MVLGGVPSVPIYHVIDLAINSEAGALGFEAWAAPAAPLIDVQKRPTMMVLGGAPTVRRSHLIAGSDRSALTSHGGVRQILMVERGRCADLDGGGKKKLHRPRWRRREGGGARWIWSGGRPGSLGGGAEEKKERVRFCVGDLGEDFLRAHTLDDLFYGTSVEPFRDLFNGMEGVLNKQVDFVCPQDIVYLHEYNTVSITLTYS